VRDATSFVAWLEDGGFSGTAAEVTTQDVRDYRDYLVELGRAPAAVNRVLVSLSLFLQAVGRRTIQCARSTPRDAEVWAALSPYTRGHYSGFGHFMLDLNRELMALDYDLPILSTPPGQEATSATPR
jgi:hypothetical protein